MRWNPVERFILLTLPLASYLYLLILVIEQCAIYMELDFDYSQCADLHNEIIRRGWEATGQDWSTHPLQSFWTAHPDRHESLSRLAHPKVIQFWQKALTIGRTEHDASFQNFFYYINDLAWPDEQWVKDTLEIMNVDADKDSRYIMLYQAANLESHSAGIILDQQTGLAIMQMSLWSSDWDDPLLPWQPLERILAQYIDMIDEDKVIAANWRAPGREHEGGPDVHEPWLVQSWSSRSLERTLLAYHRLIAAIHNRMPPSDAEDGPGTVSMLANEEDLADKMYKSGSFSRAFLLRAQRPRNHKLRFIAPGIGLPDAYTLRNQPFKDVRSPDPHPEFRDPDEEDIPNIPLLFFPAKHSGVNHQLSQMTPNPANVSSRPSIPAANPFLFYPFQSLHTTSAGIYLDPYDPRFWQDSQDTGVLALPFDLDNGHAKLSGGVPLGEAAKHYEPASAQLYQTYFNPVFTRHHVHLYLILENWVDMVVCGHWKVDEHGVAGSIEKFREAEEGEELASKYTVPLHW